MARDARRMTGCLLLSVAVLCLAVPRVDAARPATAAELQTFAGTLGLDPSCLQATVSTVDATWARVQAAVPLPPGCVTGDGFIAMHFNGSTWTDAFEASEPVVCSRYGLAEAVGRDLNICSTPPKVSTRACGSVDRGRLAARRVRARRIACRPAQRRIRLFLDFFIRHASDATSFDVAGWSITANGRSYTAESHARTIRFILGRRR
jgi:hypothetical protein